MQVRVTGAGTETESSSTSEDDSGGGGGGGGGSSGNRTTAAAASPLTTTHRHFAILYISFAAYSRDSCAHPKHIEAKGCDFAMCVDFASLSLLCFSLSPQF